jgi:hypothetical protein
VIDKNYISPLEEGGGKTTNMIYKDPLFFLKQGGFGFFCVCNKKVQVVKISFKPVLGAVLNLQ